MGVAVKIGMGWDDWRGRPGWSEMAREGTSGEKSQVRGRRQRSWKRKLGQYPRSGRPRVGRCRRGRMSGMPQTF